MLPPLQAADLRQVTTEWMLRRLEARSGGRGIGPGLRFSRDFVEAELSEQLPELLRARLPPLLPPTGRPPGSGNRESLLLIGSCGDAPHLLLSMNVLLARNVAQ